MFFITNITPNMATIKKILTSKDGSINYILPYGKSMVECRYVRRSPKYISAYVSSHNGCKMGCKFCWLSQQQQTAFKHVPIWGPGSYIDQLDTILQNSHKNDINRDVRVNVNFMARGEPLANKNIITSWTELQSQINRLVTNTYTYSEVKYNISTIMPYTIANYKLYNIFENNPVNIYYSLYSINNKFKTEWMPNAIPWERALDKLSEFQNHSQTNPNNNIVFHGAFIKNVNDDEREVYNMAQEISKRGFKRTKFNLVRLNPHPHASFQEPDEAKLKILFNIMKTHMNDDTLNKKSTIIDRIGFDAYASCGTFPLDDE